ncbi:MAG TPA: hypothetical protein VF911_15860, partial [Thermoanaerobaculia bacterium]
TAALAAYACKLAVHHPTPIDDALPLLALAVTVCAAISYPSIMLGVPLLVIAEIALFDETTRLLAFGAIVATAVALSGVRRAETRGSSAPARPSGEWRRRTPHQLVVVVILLRWIPLSNVLLFRELLLLALCLAIVFVLGRTPFAVAVAAITALLTPAIPLRTLVIPLLVLAIAIAARTFGMPRLDWQWLSTAVVAFALLFFAWSGVVARAFPYFLRQADARLPRHPVGIALAPRKSLTLDVPEHVSSLVVSGANVAHFRRGALLGRIEPGAIAVRIGDAADWGALRRDHVYGARNPLPRDPAGTIRGYGYDAWLDGAGRVALPRGAKTIRVTADASLPANASLQVEGFE